MNSLDKGTRTLGLYFDKDAPLHLEIRTEDPIIDSNSEEARLWFNTTEKVLKYTFLNPETETIEISSLGSGSSLPSDLNEFIKKLSDTNSPSGAELVGVEELVSNNEHGIQITIPAGTLKESLLNILNNVTKINENFVTYCFNKNEYIVNHELNSIYLNVQVFAKRNTEVNYKLILPDIKILNANQIKVSIMDDVVNDSYCTITKTILKQ